MKAWAIEDGVLHFVGDEVGDMFDVYTSDGKQLNKCVRRVHTKSVATNTWRLYRPFCEEDYQTELLIDTKGDKKAPRSHEP